MIVTQLLGGLGNQLFQYAAGRRLAHHHGVQLKLDSYAYQKGNFRKYGLEPFGIQAEFATNWDIAKMSRLEAMTRVAIDPWPAPISRYLGKAMSALGLKSPYYCEEHNPSLAANRPFLVEKIAAEDLFHVDLRILDAPDNVALCGFWQNEIFFSDCEDIIRRDLSWKNPMSTSVQTLAADISGSESVSLHIRRGDKVTLGLFLPDTADACYKAMTFFRTKLNRPRFFIFTDDWEWVTTHLPESDDVIYIRHELADYEDLRLMSLCLHNIIAPSTFSWWGAWLNANPEKIVVRPNLPISNGGIYTFGSIYPPSWITLS